jgi:hypothetical protein
MALPQALAPRAETWPVETGTHAYDLILTELELTPDKRGRHAVFGYTDACTLGDDLGASR